MAPRRSRPPRSRKGSKRKKDGAKKFEFLDPLLLPDEEDEEDGDAVDVLADFIKDNGDSEDLVDNLDQIRTFPSSLQLRLAQEVVAAQGDSPQRVPPMVTLENRWVKSLKKKKLSAKEILIVQCLLMIMLDLKQSKVKAQSKSTLCTKCKNIRKDFSELYAGFYCFIFLVFAVDATGSCAGTRFCSGCCTKAGQPHHGPHVTGSAERFDLTAMPFASERIRECAAQLDGVNVGRSEAKKCACVAVNAVEILQLYKARQLSLQANKGLPGGMAHKLARKRTSGKAGALHAQWAEVALVWVILWVALFPEEVFEGETVARGGGSDMTRFCGIQAMTTAKVMRSAKYIKEQSGKLGAKKSTPLPRGLPHTSNGEEVDLDHYTIAMARNLVSGLTCKACLSSCCHVTLPPDSPARAGEIRAGQP